MGTNFDQVGPIGNEIDLDDASPNQFDDGDSHSRALVNIEGQSNAGMSY